MTITPATLLDGVELHLKHPETFKVPSRNDIAGLVVGDFAKIGTTFAPVGGINGERFWVRLIITSNPVFTGVIDQRDMTHSRYHGYRDGDIVSFEARNILSICKPNPEHQ